jgi:RNA polymerase sigma-70 factor (ECF subfamily)
VRFVQDDVLIQKIIDGDVNNEAFNYIIDAYNKLLWVVAGGILSSIGTTQDIEECISDVYIELWRNPKKFIRQKGTLKNYLAVIAKNKALDRYRVLSKNKIVEMDEAIKASDDDLLDYIIDKEMYAALYEAINSLAEPNKEILIRRYFFEEKPAYIAEKTAIPVKEVENRLYQSKLKLRNILTGKEIFCND